MNGPMKYQKLGTSRDRSELLPLRTIFDHAPISRLPTETMSDIFKLCQTRYAGIYKWLYRSDGWKWFGITHVCKAWRNIAIGTQTLWTYIETSSHSSLEQTNAYLQRSGTSHLVVRHSGGKDLAVKCFLLTLNHIERIRELRISNFESKDHHIIDLLTKPAPVMEGFYIYYSCNRDIPELDGSQIFAGQAPRLRDLRLDIPTKSFSNISIMRGLKFLHFGCEQTPPALDEILSILAANPELEILEMVAKFHIPHHEIALPLKEPIQLSFLQHIYGMEIDGKLLSKFFSSVIIPANADYEITCYTCPSNDTDAIRKFPATLSSGRACDSLKLSIDSESTIIESTSTNQEHNALNKCDTLHFIWRDSTGVSCRIGPTRSLRLSSSIIKNRCWSTATELVVDIDGEEFDLSRCLPDVPWTELLRLLPRLQKISVRSVEFNDASTVKDLHKGFLQALASSIMPSDGEAVQYLCPNLKSLCLCGYNFDLGMQGLIRSLAFRAKNGVRLRRFEARDPFGISDSVLRTLERTGLVDEVIFTHT